MGSNSGVTSSGLLAESGDGGVVGTVAIARQMITLAPESEKPETMNTQLTKRRSLPCRSRGKLGLVALALGIAMMSQSTRLEALSLTQTSAYHEVDSGAGLVFRVRGSGATDTSTTSPIISLPIHA